MKIVFVGDLRYPRTPIERVINIVREHGDADVLVLLGDLHARCGELEPRCVEELCDALHKILRACSREGIGKVVYTPGGRDSVAVRKWKVILSRAGPKAHLLTITQYAHFRVCNRHVVASHGHTQLNLVLKYYIDRCRDIKEAIIKAARDAKRMESRNSRVPMDALWFIGHTQILYFDRDFGIVHCGSLADDMNFEGAGLGRDQSVWLQYYIKDEERLGYVVLEDCSIKYYNLNNDIVCEYRL